MSANLEAMILVKQGALLTSTQLLRKAGKTDTITSEKNRIRLLIGHTIFFASEKNRMTNETASHQRQTIFIR